MAKALFGHVGPGPDVRMIAEMRRLRQRVKELEAELETLRDATAAHGLVADDLILTVADAEPALT